MRLANKTAIVTGGSRGIGKAIAELFAREGATVWIWDVLEAGEETAAAIRGNGGKAFFERLSVTEPQALRAAAKIVADEQGSIDILVNNAGITRDRTLLKRADE